MRQLFNENWNYKNGEKWEKVTLPHDAMIDAGRRANAAGGAACAYFDGGVYEYEKTFSVPAEWSEKEVWLKFGGVYRNTKVYINGALAFEWAYGYTGFEVPMSALLRYGEENTVRVVADNSRLPNSRWYTGGGIYRPVELVVKNKTHFAIGGVRVETVSIDPAVIRITSERTGGTAEYAVYDGETKVAFRAGEGELAIEHAKLWSAEAPNLYTLRAALKENGKVCDEEEIVFGIRTLAWSNKGFFVNGKCVLLRGGCVHHDNGILGARAYDEAEERKVRIIKEAGYNAVRFSHNPCSEAFAAACDKYGLYLIDELSDMWYMRKKKYDYALDFETWHERDIASIVKKDYNHPSIIMYSIGNEITEPSEQKGVETAKSLVRQFHALDGTRPVTAGVNLLIIKNAANGGGEYSTEKVEASDQPKQRATKATSSALFNMIATRVGPSMNKMANSEEADKITTPLFAALDICGYNYASGRYELDGEKHPARVIYGSETGSGIDAWYAVKNKDFIFGQFIWTGTDYLGEAGAWPSRGLGTGLLDFSSLPKPRGHHRASLWCEHPVTYIGTYPKADYLSPDAWDIWNYEPGQMVRVVCYTNAPQARLLLDGKEVGALKPYDPQSGIIHWDIPYQAGELRAEGCDEAGQVLSSYSIRSSGRPYAIRVSADRTSLSADRATAHLTVEVVDEQGTVVKLADNDIRCTIEGPARLLGLENSNNSDMSDYTARHRRVFHGNLLAYLQGTGEKGEIVVRFTSPLLQDCVVRLKAE